VFFCAGLFLFSAKGFAGDPSFRWKVFETEHFEIFFPEQLRALAKNYAFSAEESHRILSAVFSDLPAKTVVVLDDSTDLTNGSATFLPYDWITVYPALPNAGDSLDEYGYWPKNILIHEYTHIANFQPVGGFYTPFLYLMGRVVTPNMLLPDWYLEGLAVDSESRLTPFGRLRSVRYQGMLRALAQDEAFPRFGIDQINEVTTPTWPYGERPYFFGSLLQKSLVDSGSSDLRERWNQRFGRRVPFLINTVAEEDFHKNFAHLLSERYQELSERAAKQTKEIEAQGNFPLTPFKEVDHEQTDAALSPDGKKLIYVSKSYRRSGIWMMERPSPEVSFSQIAPKKLFNVTQTLRLSWEGSGDGFYFDDIDMDTPFTTYRRVYHYDLAREKKKVLGPKDFRAQDPALSPDQKTLAVIETLKNGRQRLSFFDPGQNTKTSVYTAPLLERLSRPTYWPEKNALLFVQKNLQGKDLLRLFDLKTHRLSTLPLPFDRLSFPLIHAGALYVISSKTGVTNVYRVQNDLHGVTALSNATTWLHDFTLTSSSLILSRLGSEGLKLYETPLAENYHPQDQKPLVSYREDAPPTETLPTEKDFQTLIKREKSFYPFKYLLPRYWIPFIYPVDGGVLVQGSTSGTDPVGVNQYLLSGSYDSVTGEPSYGLEYLNSSFPVNLSIFAAKFQEYLAASDLSLEKDHLGASLLYPLGMLSKRWSTALGYAATKVNTKTSPLHREGPEALISYSDLLDRRFSDDGRLFSLSYQKFLSGPDHLAYDRTSFVLGKKFSSFFPKDQSLWLSVKGAFSNQLPTNRLLAFGERSLGANYLVNLTESQFLYRGYPSGSLVGRQLLNSNLEYRFPLKDIYRGSGTEAIFLKTATGVLFVDGLATDGLYYDFDKNSPAYHPTKISEVHLSTGAELHLDTTVAYHLPLTFIVGGYYGLSRQIGENFSFFLGLGGLDPLSAAPLLKK
jgi:hypothetical protein